MNDEKKSPALRFASGSIFFPRPCLRLSVAHCLTAYENDDNTTERLRHKKVDHRILTRCRQRRRLKTPLTLPSRYSITLQNNMETKKAFSEASVYVGTYAKYNEGSTYGDWLDLDNYDRMWKFLNACKKLHEDEEDPKFMFQDWEHIPDGLISESELSPAIFELKDLLDELEEDPFIVWVGDYSDWKEVESDPKKAVEIFRDQYCGEWDSETAYAEQLFDELYLHDIPSYARSYINYEAFARDLFMYDYDYIEGYVFRTC